MKAQVNEIKEGLQHFHGTEMFYQIPLLRTRFTDGLKYLANAADCFLAHYGHFRNCKKSDEPKRIYNHRLQKIARR